MDATVQTKRRVRPVTRAAGIIFLVVAGLTFALDGIERATLVDPIPVVITFFAGAAGFGAGCWFSAQLLKTPSSLGRWRRTLGLIAMPIFTLAIGTFLARVAVEAVAFNGLNPLAYATNANVEGKYRTRMGQEFASVSFGPGTRNVDVKVTADLYDRLEPYRMPGRDCIALSIETGRWGVRRTMLPSQLFDEPISADRYRLCEPVPDSQRVS